MTHFCTEDILFNSTTLFIINKSQCDQGLLLQIYSNGTVVVYIIPNCQQTRERRRILKSRKAYTMFLNNTSASCSKRIKIANSTNKDGWWSFHICKNLWIRLQCEASCSSDALIDFSSLDLIRKMHATNITNKGQCLHPMSQHHPAFPPLRNDMRLVKNLQKILSSQVTVFESDKKFICL